MWNGPLLGYYDGEGYTIRDAIHYWYWNVSDNREGVAFRDECSGPQCSNSCPEEIVLMSLQAQPWSTPVITVIIIAVLFIAAVCFVLKVNIDLQQIILVKSLHLLQLYWVLWSFLLQRKQQIFLSGVFQGPSNKVI